MDDNNYFSVLGIQPLYDLFVLVGALVHLFSNIFVCCNTCMSIINLVLPTACLLYVDFQFWIYPEFLVLLNVMADSLVLEL